MKNIVAIDLFSGAGGTTSGLKKSGIKVAAAVEIDPVAAKTYARNNPEVCLLEDDIKNISGQLIRKSISYDQTDKLLLVACPPCQGFSTIGKKLAHDARNQLIFEYMRLIHELEPDFLLMENVSGILSKKNQPIFQEFINSLKDYLITYDILNSADYGVPQTRKRFVLHGVKKSIINKDFKLDLPPKTHSENEDLGLPEWIKSDVIMDLPEIKCGEEYCGDGIYNHTANRLSDLNIKRIRYIRKHGGSRNVLPDELVLNCHKNRTGHTDVYGILDTSKPAITLTGGCMTYSKGRFGHPTQDRALSAREAARLQSFDDDYIFEGNNSQLAKQIGNAVPVKLAEASGKYFMSILQEVG